MYYLIYTSFAVNQFTEADLEALLLKSRAKNARLGITGMLYYYPGSFIQLIEGEKENVKTLFDAILADRNHHHVTVVKEGNIEKPFFPNWTMGYKFLNKKDLAEGDTSDDLGVIDNASVVKLFSLF